MAGPKLRNQELAAAALAGGRSVADAAKAANCSERTISNWLQSPTFRSRVAEHRGEMVGRALGCLSDAMTAAAGVLIELLTHGDANVRHKAARSVLELALKVREQTDLEERLVALEATLKGEADGESNRGTAKTDREASGEEERGPAGA